MKRFRIFFSSLILSLWIAGLAGGVLPVAAEALSTDPTPYRAFLPLAVSQNETTRQVQVSLEAFIEAVADGQPEVVKGVYVDRVLALRVVQQPDGNPYYISSSVEEATQYDLAKQFGVTGLIAHNTLAGEKYFDLSLGQTVQIIFGDGQTLDYQIAEISHYRALEPSSFTSSFVSLSTGETFTASQLFTLYYMGGDQVTFQTCIAQNGLSNWGRAFIVATPLEADSATNP